MRALLVTLACLAVSACASAPPTPAQRPLAKLEPTSFYSGTWYEIGRRPMWLTNGCVAGGTTYGLRGDLGVEVLDFCHQGSPTGKRRTIGGPARILDPGANARLQVDYHLFGLKIRREYQVLELADDRSWFISADPSFNDLWIYTRSPHPSAQLVATLTARARTLGYDVSRLEFPEPGA